MNQYLQNFFNLSSDLFCVLDKRGHFVEVSPAWEKVLGWSPSELNSKSIFDWIDSKEDRPFDGKPQSLRFETRFNCKDGSHRILIWSGALAPEKDLYFLFVRDVTEERRTKSQTKTQIDALFDSMVEGVVVQDASGKIIQYNRAALEILGLSADQILGRTSYDPEWKVVSEDLRELPRELHPAGKAIEHGSAR